MHKCESLKIISIGQSAGKVRIEQASSTIALASTLKRVEMGVPYYLLEGEDIVNAHMKI